MPQITMSGLVDANSVITSSFSVSFLKKPDLQPIMFNFGYSALSIFAA